MIKDTTMDYTKGSFTARIHRAPYLGILAFIGVLLWKPTAHLVAVGLIRAFPGEVGYLVGAVVGLLGFTLIWKGFERDELTATCMGFIGGGLIWIGWFEYSSRFFGELLQIEPIMHEGRRALGANNQVTQASAFLFLAVLIFLAANKDTHCRMFMWFHRNFRLRPEAPTGGYKRQFARITAMEVVFINWFFHIVNITLYDPRIFGPTHPVRYAACVVFLVWGLYLLLFKLPKYRSMGGAIRYSIATVGILWISIEMASRWGWYTEVWVRPSEFPVMNAILILLFLLTGVLANMTTDRGKQLAS